MRSSAWSGGTEWTSCLRGRTTRDLLVCCGTSGDVCTSTVTRLSVQPAWALDDPNALDIRHRRPYFFPLEELFGAFISLHIFLRPLRMAGACGRLRDPLGNFM